MGFTAGKALENLLDSFEYYNQIKRLHLAVKLNRNSIDVFYVLTIIVITKSLHDYYNTQLVIYGLSS